MKAGKAPQSIGKPQRKGREAHEELGKGIVRKMWLGLKLSQHDREIIALNLGQYKDKYKLTNKVLGDAYRKNLSAYDNRSKGKDDRAHFIKGIGRVILPIDLKESDKVKYKKRCRELRASTSHYLQLARAICSNQGISINAFLYNITRGTKLNSSEQDIGEVTQGLSIMMHTLVNDLDSQIGLFDKFARIHSLRAKHRKSGSKVLWPVAKPSDHDEMEEEQSDPDNLWVTPKIYHEAVTHLPWHQIVAYIPHVFLGVGNDFTIADTSDWDWPYWPISYDDNIEMIPPENQLHKLFTKNFQAKFEIRFDDKSGPVLSSSGCPIDSFARDVRQARFDVWKELDGDVHYPIDEDKNGKAIYEIIDLENKKEYIDSEDHDYYNLRAFVRSCSPLCWLVVLPSYSGEGVIPYFAITGNFDGVDSPIYVYEIDGGFLESLKSSPDINVWVNGIIGNPDDSLYDVIEKLVLDAEGKTLVDSWANTALLMEHNPIYEEERKEQSKLRIINKVINRK
jgi:hypothetical protein